MEKNSGNIAQIRSLTFTYPERENPALCAVDLNIKSGEFIVVCGPSGCGKTTLLRKLKPTLSPHGASFGEILFEGKLISELNAREEASKIGFVMQSPDNQIVTDKVWHELAFGLESLGHDTPTIRLRVAEMASFFGIQAWFHKNVSELSGGQKQLLALASVMTLQPSLLILDEPTSQLDPIAAADFLATVGKINRELGVSVIITEHRLEEVFPLASRAVVMDKGAIISVGSPSEVGEQLRILDHGMFAAMPVPMRVWVGVPDQSKAKHSYPCPITVGEGREWLQKMAIVSPLNPDEPWKTQGVPAVEVEGAWFRYAKDSPDVVKGVDFKAYPACLTAILGGNGTGKTTTLSLIAGLNKPYRGKVKIEGIELDKIPAEKMFDKLLGVLPQNPQTLFVAKTVREDLMEILNGFKISKSEKAEKLYNMALLCRLENLLDSHPYDLSGGEQQRAALAKVLLLEPKILLLDEPTKGLDAEFKIIFASILKRLTKAGVAVIMVSHDIEFCAEYADYCALFFDGGIVTQNPPRAFFSGNSFYTSAANRMAREIIPTAITAADIITALGGTNKPEKSDLIISEFPNDKNGTYMMNEKKQEDLKPISNVKKLSGFRIAALCLIAITFIVTSVIAVFQGEGITTFMMGGTNAALIGENPITTWKYTAIILALAVEILAAAVVFSWKRGNPEWKVQTERNSRKLPKRTLAAAAMILLAIPLTIYFGVFFLGDRKYYFISLLIILETMIPFAFVFEKRKPQARELVIISVLCAIAVAGRTAFFMLPQFKPVVAMTIIAGVAFGGEAGFLVGAMTGFVSNMFFGQGPLTPWQMFGFGIIGFLAGVLFKKGLLLRSTAPLCVFGGLATFFIYGLLLDSSVVIINQNNPTFAMFVASWIQGLQFNLIHAISTVVFLGVAAKPMLEKLDRIKVKYGLVTLS